MTEFLSFLGEYREELGDQTLEHFALTFFSLFLAVAVGVPLGLLVSRRRKLERPVLGVASALQTVPSVALLGFLIPLMGIGEGPAIFALFVYALLPIVRNAYTGIAEVDRAIVEAARGMGMTDGQVLRKVELPLAAPVIFAGVRTAAVINVGVATLASVIGAGGLGKSIFGGIDLNNTNMILAGAIPAAVMALSIDGLLAYIQGLPFRSMQRALIVLAVVFAGATGYYAVDALDWEANGDGSNVIVAAFTPEFAGRPDGLPGLQARYDLPLETVTMNSALMYKAVHQGEVDLICGYSTDGRIKAYDLKSLRDDRGLFPPYYCAPLVRQQTLRRHPGLQGALEKLAGRIDDATMTELNFQVDSLKRSPKSVARGFLQEEGLYREPTAADGQTVEIGYKKFTESYIVAEMLAMLVRGHAGLPAETRLLGGTQVCFGALLSGDVDLYPEYTGTGLLLLLDTPPAVADSLGADPQAVFDYVSRESEKRHELQWLLPLGFNNTYAVLMRREHAERLGVGSISDLEGYLAR